MLPLTVPFADAFRIAFAYLAESTDTLPEAPTDPVATDANPDEVRFDFAYCVEVAAAAFGLPDDAQTHGELADIVCERWTGLAEFLTRTTQ